MYVGFIIRHQACWVDQTQAKGRQLPFPLCVCALALTSQAALITSQIRRCALKGPVRLAYRLVTFGLPRQTNHTDQCLTSQCLTSATSIPTCLPSVMSTANNNITGYIVFHISRDITEFLPRKKELQCSFIILSSPIGTKLNNYIFYENAI